MRQEIPATEELEQDSLAVVARFMAREEFALELRRFYLESEGPSFHCSYCQRPVRNDPSYIAVRIGNESSNLWHGIVLCQDRESCRKRYEAQQFQRAVADEN